MSVNEPKVPFGENLDKTATAFERISSSLTNLSRAIFRTPYGFLVIALCIVIYYQYQQNLYYQKELEECNKEYVQTLKEVKSGLEEISDTTKTENNVPFK